MVTGDSPKGLLLRGRFGDLEAQRLAAGGAGEGIDLALGVYQHESGRRHAGVAMRACGFNR